MKAIPDKDLPDFSDTAVSCLLDVLYHAAERSSPLWMTGVESLLCSFTTYWQCACVAAHCVASIEVVIIGELKSVDASVTSNSGSFGSNHDRLLVRAIDDRVVGLFCDKGVPRWETSYSLRMMTP
jgi:hypothetical protein